MQFEARQFVTERFKTAAGVVAFLRAYGVSELPTEHAVMKWLKRDSIPGDWLAVLLALCEVEDGTPVSLHQYLRG
jgi:hypothetical protein